MVYKVNRWKTARGIVYLYLDGSKRTITKFSKELLSEVDPSLLKASEKELKKRKDGRFAFIEGQKITIIVMENHVFIKPEENYDGVLEIIKKMISLTK